MDLTTYVESIRTDLASAAAAGGDDARAVAERLGAALDSAAHLALLDAIAGACAEITREITPGSVEVRLRGREPEFVVTLPPYDVVNDVPTTPSTPPPAEPEDGGTARMTLRLPESLKRRIEDAATAEGFSVNAWLVRAVNSALAGPPPPPPPPGPGAPPNPPRQPTWPGTPRLGRRVTGWVR